MKRKVPKKRRILQWTLVGKKVQEYRLKEKISQQQLSAKLEIIAVYICRGSIFEEN
jgi:hypothetical protein